MSWFWHFLVAKDSAPCHLSTVCCFLGGYLIFHKMLYLFNFLLLSGVVARTVLPSGFVGLADVQNGAEEGLEAESVLLAFLKLEQAWEGRAESKPLGDRVWGRRCRLPPRKGILQLFISETNQQAGKDENAEFPVHAFDHWSNIGIYFPLPAIFGPCVLVIFNSLPVFKQGRHCSRWTVPLVLHL